jgi:hypothetical protein
MTDAIQPHHEPGTSVLALVLLDMGETGGAIRH